MTLDKTSERPANSNSLCLGLDLLLRLCTSRLNVIMVRQEYLRGVEPFCLVQFFCSTQFVL